MPVPRCWSAVYLPIRLVTRAPGMFYPIHPSLIEGLEVEYPEDMEIHDVANCLLESHVYTWYSDDDVQPQPGTGMARLDFCLTGLVLVPLQGTPSHSGYLVYNVCPTCVPFPIIRDFEAMQLDSRDLG